MQAPVAAAHGPGRPALNRSAALICQGAVSAGEQKCVTHATKICTRPRCVVANARSISQLPLQNTLADGRGRNVTNVIMARGDETLRRLLGGLQRESSRSSSTFACRTAVVHPNGARCRCADYLVPSGAESSARRLFDYSRRAAGGDDDGRDHRGNARWNPISTVGPRLENAMARSIHIRAIDMCTLMMHFAESTFTLYKCMAHRCR